MTDATRTSGGHSAPEQEPPLYTTIPLSTVRIAEQALDRIVAPEVGTRS